MQPEPTSPPGRVQVGREKAAAVEDTTDVDTTAVSDVRSNAENRVIAVRTMVATASKAEQSSPEAGNDAKAGPLSKVFTEAKGKGKEVIDTNDGAIGMPSDDNSFLSPRPPPRRRPGWGRDLNEDILHMVPASYGGRYRKRAVFRLWPRDPNGNTLMPSEGPRGTLSPDGYPWGATLYDFYNISRFPQIPLVRSIMTGSAILEAMTELGELNVAGPEIEWAKSEGEPRKEGVADTAAQIESIERTLQLRFYHNFSMLDDVRRMALPIRVDCEDEDEEAPKVEKEEQGGKDDETEGDGGDGNNCDKDREEEEETVEHDDETEDDDEDEIPYDDMEVDPASIPSPPTIPITSPFHPTHYPKPWPFIPFENPRSVVLQERLPLYLLPQTLYVHDPFNLLTARQRRFHDPSWTSRPNIVRTYNLGVSESVREEEEARRKAEELEEFKARTLIVLRYRRTEEQIENHEPVIEVPLPPYRRRTTKVEESHLYLSPVAKVGQGHHSIVYKGEWELPRDLFTRPKLCSQCFKASVDKEIQKLKDTGRWEKMLRTVGWGPTDFTGRQPPQAELNEVCDTINLERDGEIIEREIICIVSPNVSPSSVFPVVDSTRIWKMFMQQRSATTLQLDLTNDGDDDEATTGPYVATVRIDPVLSYESQKPCVHGPRRFAIPLTTKFTVVAKLSIENDCHLAREARNYQQFPEHFFHHFNGYSLIGQLRTIVPVNAVVPQFYGHYMPKRDGGEKQGEESYLSPILLLEHCGEPIDPENLSEEDQEECASLLLRFQRAGWLHESVAPRNFLVQYGKPTEFPFVREGNPEPSFRLIDFGRSRIFEKAEEKRAEEAEALRMFEKLRGKMSVTLSL